MWPPRIVDRIVVQSDLTAARRRAADDLPFSPAWDAAMGRVEDLERELWRLDEASRDVRAEAFAVAGRALGRR